MGMAATPLGALAYRVDYAGPLLGHMFLVTGDAHSKWMDVKALKSATSHSTIEHLRSLFATHSLPELLVSDNGTVFTSSEFQEFLKHNGIRHSTCAPYHPATNGLAEQTFTIHQEAFEGHSRKEHFSIFVIV